MRYTTHTCGYSIAITYHHNGVAFVAHFIDNNEESPMCGQEIEICPQCGETMLPRDFEEDQRLRAEGHPELPGME